MWNQVKYEKMEYTLFHEFFPTYREPVIEGVYSGPIRFLFYAK